MTVENMDICLNISSAPASAASTKIHKNKAEFFKPQVKRLIKKSQGKQEKAKNQFKGRAVSEGENGRAKTRVKQKSLATIVANNIARSKAVPVLNKSNTINNNVKESNESKFSLLTTTEQKVTEKPIVSFTKLTKTNAPKTILAKPQNVDENKPKKSLSDIFAKTASSMDTETKLLPVRSKAEDNDAGDTPSHEEFPHAKNIQRSKDSRFKQFGKQDSRPNNRNNSKGSFSKSEDKQEKPNYNKTTSKVSSLFGNNPEVPNIGQRFVKPVNETVFSKTSFKDLGIHDYMVSNLEQNMKITNMTTVQQRAIPVILSGRNVLVRSQTGSGKTLTYALPIVESLHKIRPKLMRNSGLKALVVVPTRELALQTYECFLKLVKPFTWIVPGYLVGGEKRKAEKARLRRGCTILVATPGRLLDHVKHTEALTLTDVKCFVLDEADRMLDMGYEKDVSEIVEALKGSSLDAQKSSYDPLQLIRDRGAKKTIVEVEEEADNSQKDAEDDAVSKDNNMESEQDEEEVQDDSNKQEYHSGTDSDSDDQEFPIRAKKSKKGVHQNPKKSTKTRQDQTHEEGAKQTDVTDDTTDPDVGSISSRQTILLSATLTAAVEKLAGLTMTNPVFVDAAEENLTKVGGNLSETNDDLVVPQGVAQSYIVTPPKLRMVTLSAYIAGKCQAAGQHKILVFMATQDMIDYHADILSKILGKPRDDEDEDSEPLVDVEFFKLHGSMTQKERTDVFKTFRKARSGVLLCTDVAARGLDMPKVDTVVQYTGPLSARDYVHRVGRTARAGTSGVSTIFLTPPEIEFVRMLESRRIRIKQEDMNDILDKLMGPLSRHHSVEATATALQNEFENLVLEDKKLHAKACKAYVSWIRFYSCYPRDMREIFNRRELHLGHFAKSFALRDPPLRIGGIGKKLREEEPTKQQHNNRLSNERPDKAPQKRQQEGAAGGGLGQQKAGMLKRSRMLNTSEYGSGLEPVKKSKKS